MEYHVFISYPHEEFDVAKEIYDLLSGRFKVFMDKYSIVPGADWTAEIVRAQQKSAMTIAIVSNNTKNACYEKDEITRAINLRKHQKHVIVPIVVSCDGSVPDIPFGLQNTQYILIDKNYDMAQVFAKITQAMRPNAARFGFSPGVDCYSPPEHTPSTYNSRIDQRQIEDQIREDDILNFFLRRIQRYSYKKTFLFAFLDVEKFTQLNTIYGKRCADNVLRAIEELIGESHETLYCHRLFADEFCMLIPGCKVDEGLRIMEDLQESIYLYGWHSLADGLRVSTSIGISEMHLDKEYTKADVKEGIVRAAIGCATIGDILYSLHEKDDNEPRVPKSKFPRRIKKGPKHVTQAQLDRPLRERCS